MTEPVPNDAIPTNWERWGADDQLGTLNFITDSARARGVGEARMGRVVSLARPVDPVPLSAAPFSLGSTGMPAGVLHVMNFNGSPTRVLTDVLIFNTHHADLTHIDALVHVPTEEKVYPGVGLNEAVAFGAVRHGSTTAFLGGQITRGVFLDLAPGGRLDDDHPVTGADLDEATRVAGVTIESGDALVVRCGWGREIDLGDPHPWLTLDGVRWLADREVSFFLGDLADKFNPAGPGIPMPLHQVALPRLGIPLIDRTDIDELTAVSEELDRRSFLFVLGVIPVRGATGLPVNPLTIF